MSLRISFAKLRGVIALLVLIIAGGAQLGAEGEGSGKDPALRTADAGDYAGKWLLAVSAGSRKSRGSLEIKDEGGAAKAELKLRQKGEPQKVTGLSKTPQGLLVLFENPDENGTKALRLVLKRDGEKLSGLAMDEKGGVSAEITAAREGSAAAKEIEGSIGSEEAASETRAAAIRNQMGFSKLSLGGKDIVIVVGAVTTKGKDFKAVSEVKDGAVVPLTESFAIKLKTPRNLKFGDKTIKAGVYDPAYPGVYSLWLKKAGAGWHLVFNTEADVWGTMYNPGADVAEVPLEVGKAEKTTERLSVELRKGDEKSATLVISWGEREWKAPFSLAE